MIPLTTATVLAEIHLEETAFEQLLREFPWLQEVPFEEAQQMLGSSSPRVSRRSHAVALRFNEILALKAAAFLVVSREG